MNMETPRWAQASALRRWVAPLSGLAVVVAILLLPTSAATAWTPTATNVTCARAHTSEPTGLRSGAHPVVLVHGWSGSVLTETRTALEKKMTPGWQFLLFDYHDASTQWADSPQISTCLGRYILEVSKAHKTAGGDGIVYLVGHSMGGLAVRFAANETIDNARVSDHIGGLVTLDTPHAGSPWGNTAYASLYEFVTGFGFSPIPPDGSRARTCLATHTGDKGLPPGCVAAPYLPSTIPIHEIAGQGTLRRTFFGIYAYDLPLGGDSIVGSGSQQGYIGSGPATGPRSGNKVGLSTITCEGDDSALIAKAAAMSRNIYITILGGFAQMGSDSAALDATLSNTASPARALLLTANATLPCSHARITTNDQAITATAQALRRFADSHQTSSMPVQAPLLSTDGYGPLRFGMTLKEARVALGAPVATQDAGPPGCVQGSSTAAPQVTFAVVDGKVLAAGVAGGGAQAVTTMTTSGLHVGSSLADLKARVSGLTSRGYVSTTGVTEYDLKAASGRAAAFIVDDRTQQITGFLFGDQRYVIGVEFICL